MKPSEIKVGDSVFVGEGRTYSYEVALIKSFPHGPMVGIYDDPPSKHIDYWNAESLTPAVKCATCDGSGDMPYVGPYGNTWVTCENCDGKGHV